MNTIIDNILAACCFFVPFGIVLLFAWAGASKTAYFTTKLELPELILVPRMAMFHNRNYSELMMEYFKKLRDDEPPFSEERMFYHLCYEIIWTGYIPVENRLLSITITEKAIFFHFRCSNRDSRNHTERTHAEMIRDYKMRSALCRECLYFDEIPRCRVMSSRSGPISNLFGCTVLAQGGYCDVGKLANKLNNCSEVSDDEIARFEDCLKEYAPDVFDWVWTKQGLSSMSNRSDVCPVKDELYYIASRIRNQERKLF